MFFCFVKLHQELYNQPECLIFCFVLVKESNGPTDSYAAIAQVDIQRQEPESLRKWREEQKERLEALGEYLIIPCCALPSVSA